VLSNQDLIKLFAAVLVFLAKFLLIGALPVILFFWLILYAFNVINIWQQLIFTIGLVYVLGGFFVLGIKLLELIFRTPQVESLKYDSFSNNSTSLKFNLKAGTDFSPDQILKLWQFISQNLDPEDPQTPQSDNIISHELIIRNKAVEWYLSLPKQLSKKVLQYTKSQLDSLEVTKVPDPLGKWPTNWSNNRGLGPYKSFYACDYGLAKSNLYPLQDLAILEDDPSPILSFGDEIIRLDKDMTVVVQTVLSTTSIQDYINDWNDQVLAIQSIETADHLNPEPKDIKNVQNTTKDTQDIMATLQSKITKPHFQTHLRLAVFYLKGKKSELHLVEKYFNQYLEKLSTAYQQFSKVKPSATNYILDTSGMIFGTNIIAPLLQRFYQAKSQIRNQKIQYWALRHRALNVPTSTHESVLDCDSIATVSHMIKPQKRTDNPISKSKLGPSKVGKAVTIKAGLKAKLQRLKLGK
jgi:hypothetical protein